MALTRQFTTPHGIDLPNAYFRIDGFRGDRNTVTISVSVYANAAAQNDGKPAIQALEFTLPTPNTSKNMFADAYNWLKTQDLFQVAQDC